jgi:AraC-like DNA-binding protein
VLSGPILRTIGALDHRNIFGPWPNNWVDRKLPRSARPPFESEDHSHWSLEIVLTLEGNCALSYNSRRFILRERDLVYFPPNIPHDMTCIDRSVPYRLACLVVIPEQLGLIITSYERSRGFRIDDTVTVPTNDIDLREAMNRLARCATQPDPPDVLTLKEIMLTVSLSLLRRLLRESRKDRRGARREIMTRARNYIDGQGGRSVSLKEVASVLHISPNYLTSLFHEEAGTPLGAYIRRRRIAEAKSLLASSDRSVAQIANELGFNDPYAFSRTFKRIAGVSPLTFRRVKR